MSDRSWTRHHTIAAILAISAGVGVLIHAAAQDPTPQEQRALEPELTPAERTLAERLASGALRQRALVRGRLYLSGMELLRDKAEEAKAEPQRQALVIHYRYDGDLTILTSVNLTREAVVAVDTARGIPAPLAEEEFARARELAMADPRVARSLRGDPGRLVVERLLSRSSDPRDPLFGHRLVRLLFRYGPDYVSDPVVTVDLTTGTVLVEPAKP
jgi:hypothetical protein